MAASGSPAAVSSTCSTADPATTQVDLVSKIQQSNAKHYKSNTVTEAKEYEGRPHLLTAEERWEEVADYALDWAMSHASTRAAAR